MSRKIRNNFNGHSNIFSQITCDLSNKDNINADKVRMKVCLQKIVLIFRYFYNNRILELILGTSVKNFLHVIYCYLAQATRTSLRLFSGSMLRNVNWLKVEYPEDKQVFYANF